MYITVRAMISRFQFRFDTRKIGSEGNEIVDGWIDSFYPLNSVSLNARPFSLPLSTWYTTITRLIVAQVISANLPARQLPPGNLRSKDRGSLARGAFIISRSSTAIALTKTSLIVNLLVVLSISLRNRAAKRPMLGRKEGARDTFRDLGRIDAAKKAMAERKRGARDTFRDRKLATLVSSSQPRKNRVIYISREEVTWNGLPWLDE